MGKDSLIKSTTKKKPASEKVNETKQAKKTTAKAKKAVNAKPDVKPKKKTVKAKESARKKPAVKSKPTKIKKKTPKKTTPAKKPSKVQAKPKPTPVVKTSIPAKVQAETKPTPVVKASIPDKPDSIDHIPPSETKPADPAEKMLYYGVAGFVLLVLVIVLASWMNTQHYYAKTSDGAVGIWQGKFAPKGAKHLISFPGLQMAKPIKEVYTANEVFPIIYQYYLDKADMLLEVPGMPDFDGVKEYLDKSLAYATTREMKKIIKSRLDSINLMVLLYKAEVVASKNTLEDLETALGYLKKALAYEMDELDSARLKQKVELVRTKIKDLKAAAKATEGDDHK
jgi:colicin import membrane protein